LNRISQIAYPDQTVGYTYDSCSNGIGRLCAISDRSGTTAYAYDPWGRVTSKTQTIDALAQTVSYGYNGAGQLTTITLPSGHVLTYGYANNRPVSLAVDGVTILDSAVYRPFGPLESWTWGNSAAGAPNDFTRAIDADYRITGVRSDLPASGTQPLFDRQFSWDDQGRVMAITDLANSSLSASYGYDALDRVTSASQSSSSWAYSYDGTGDRLTSTDGAGTASYAFYPGSHRLQSIAGARSKSYLYDGAGNQTSDGTTTWTYGGDNRPTQAGSAVFVFNALGQRVEKVAASTTRFVYDEAGHLAGEYADDGSLIEETVWLGDLPVATLRPNGAGVDAYYVHTDQLGTPRMVTRPSDNQVVWRWDNTEPFGSSSPDDNPSGLGAFAYNLRFPGQYYDAETGTNYNYFRDYDPSIGRYVESDPIGLRGGLNTYSYVEASPISKLDESGLSSDVLDGRPRPPGVTDVSAEAKRRLAQQLTDMLRQLRDRIKSCPPNTKCDPPAGTKCFLGPHMPGLGERPHGAYSGWHYQIYEMQQFGGTCQWKRVSDRRGGVVNKQPQYMSYCQSYPSFVRQMPDRY
jgi:RHS repeat-associated protein